MSHSFSRRPSDSHQLRQRVMVAIAAIAILAGCAWLSLVIITRIDELFLPGQGIGLPSVVTNLPGVQKEEEGPQKRINILVMGLDRRPNEQGLPTRTDTMFVLTIDPQTKTAGILGIPRDLWVEIPYRDGSGFFEAKVNTAYPTGEMEEYEGGGTGLVKDVIQHNLGVELDHYVVIDFDGFIELIDGLGGIDVYVPEPIYDPYYSHTERLGEYQPVDYDVGVHHMDGTHALGYARTRYGSSDLDRIQRQQRVIFAAMDKATELNWVNVTKLGELWDSYKDIIETDIPDYQAGGFALLATQIDQEKIAALSIGAATWGEMVGPQSVQKFDPEMVHDIVQALFSDHELLSEGALVEIQNDPSAEGLASRAADYLTEFGFLPDSLTYATVVGLTVRAETEIIDFSSEEGAVDTTVARLASLLSVPPERIRRAGNGDEALRTTESDVLVILGADSQTQPFATDSSDSEASGG